jgi:hypothetical protein
MKTFRTMGKLFWLGWALLFIILFFGSFAYADDSQNKIEQQQREFEQRRAAIRAKIGLPPTDLDTHTDRFKGTSLNPIPFDAKSAPSPDLCFLKFVAMARTAGSMSELLPFLSYSEQRMLKERQERWNPHQASENTQKLQQTNSKMSAQAVKFFNQDPYTNALSQKKGIADRILRVRTVKITEANKAELEVATQHNKTRSNVSGSWKVYPYGTARVEMLGEGNYWRFTGYKDNFLYYTEPQ